MKLWKVFKAGMKSNNGNIEWPIGKWNKHEGPLKICRYGFHASERIIDAMQYTSAEIIAEVEVQGASQKHKNKQVWSEMRVVRTWEWTKGDSVALAIFASEKVLKIFEDEYPDDKKPRQAIDAAKKWLKNPTEENRIAAEEAAGAAAWAAGAAARAEEAARAAAWAAGAAARAAEAAWAAAWAAGAAAWAAGAAKAEEAAREAAGAAEAAKAAEAAVNIFSDCESFIKERLNEKH